jgi:hypothetical protein
MPGNALDKERAGCAVIRAEYSFGKYLFSWDGYISWMIHISIHKRNWRNRSSCFDYLHGALISSFSTVCRFSTV